MKRRDFFIKSCEPAGHKPTGFTLVELAVVLGILGLLAALLVPAVQQARSASRRVACMNHLRQLGLAMHNIVDATGGFPTSNNPQPGYWRMLPYLDQGALYERLVRYDIPEAFNVDVFNCPEDGWLSGEVGEANYFLNSGTRFRDHSHFYNGFRVGGGGGQEDLRPSEVTDGLSQTAAISERLGTPMATSYSTSEMEAQPRRFFWFTEVRYSGEGEEPLANEQCRSHRTTTFPQWASLATNALQQGYGYDHRLPPNHRGCYNGPEGFNMEFAHAIIPASSDHPGGAHVLMGDGSVHFVNENVDEAVWQSVGSRNGNETLTLPFQ